VVFVRVLNYRKTARYALGIPYPKWFKIAFVDLFYDIAQLF
jgi:hypothetical protein